MKQELVLEACMCYWEVTLKQTGVSLKGMYMLLGGNTETMLALECHFQRLAEWSDSLQRIVQPT